MGTIVGLLLGAGLLLIWLSCWPAETTGHTRRFRVGERLQDVLVQAGMPTVRPVALVIVCALLATAIFTIATALTGSPPIAVCFAALAATLPPVFISSRARRRREELRSVWPEVVDDLVSAIRAGMSLPEALIALSDRGPQELRADMRRFAEDYRATGRFEESLDRLKAHLADPVADRIIEALRITREVGGTDLVRLLRTLSQLLREDLRTRGELQARQSWTVNGARLAAAAPWVVLLLLSGRSETATAFNTAAGAVVLGAGAGITAGAYWLMVRLGRLPEEDRVLR